MRFGKGRPVDAGFVRADGAKRVEIRKDSCAVHLRVIFRHEAIAPVCSRASDYSP
jgi:hypothetical protein